MTKGREGLREDFRDTVRVTALRSIVNHLLGALSAKNLGLADELKLIAEADDMRQELEGLL